MRHTFKPVYEIEADVLRLWFSSEPIFIQQNLKLYSEADPYGREISLEIIKGYR